MSQFERILWVLATALLLWYAVSVDVRLRVYNELANTAEENNCYAKDGICK